LAHGLEDASDGAAMAAAFVAETRRRARTLADAIDDAGVVYAVEPLHRMRLAAKKLRYVLEVGSTALPGVGGRATRRLRQLQAQLGGLHDIQMTQQHVREAAAAEVQAAPALARELADLDRALEVRCRQAHAKILGTRTGLDELLRDVERAAAGLLVPREIGRMARMRVAGRRRVAAR
jgi:CHAD domain-containing protein